MTRVLIAIIIAGLLGIAFVLYRSHNPSNPQVDPAAREQIDKARQR